MNRVFITGDKHGDFYSIINFIEKYELGYGDFIIILGDMGLYWRKDGKDAKAFIQMYEKDYEVNLMFIDGNHENFDRLKQIPVGENGLSKISEHIYYLPRGCAFELCGKKYLCMGGADSIDKFRREEHFTWWKDEQITEEDIKGIKGNYDYVLTHCCPTSVFNKNKFILCTLAGMIDEDIVDHTSEDRLEEMSKNIQFKHWLFGHYHTDVQLDDKFRCLYNNFIEIE